MDYGDIQIRKKIIILLVVVIGLLLARFDFAYSARNYQVQEGDTLWSFMSEQVFHSAAIARLSLSYLEENHADIDWDLVEANINGEGGYVLSVRTNLLSIRGPDEQYVVRSFPVLPSYSLVSHLLQVVTYDLVLIAILAYACSHLVDYEFKFSWDLIRSSIMVPLGIALVPVFVFLYVGALSSLVYR